MQAVLLSVHVLAGILFVGPVAVAASLFPRYAPVARAVEGADRSVGVARVLHRITRVYGVLALAVPMMGFGAAPTFLALTLYGLLPIFENSLAALSNLPAPVVEAARGMGMTEGQVLRQVELPLALPLIIAGVRLTTVISLSTAAIGSTVAAKSLGEVIIAGLLSDNAAFILQGGFIIAGLAVLIHELLSWAETRSRHA